MKNKSLSFFVCSFCSRGWHDLCQKKYLFELNGVALLVKCNCAACNSYKLDMFTG
jgi:hypothetical protein